MSSLDKHGSLVKCLHKVMSCKTLIRTKLLPRRACDDDSALRSDVTTSLLRVRRLLYTVHDVVVSWVFSCCFAFIDPVTALTTVRYFIRQIRRRPVTSYVSASKSGNDSSRFGWHRLSSYRVTSDGRGRIDSVNLIQSRYSG